MMMKRQRKQS